MSERPGLVIRTILRALAFAAISTGVAAMAACSDDDDPRDEDRLTGTYWVLTDVAGQPALPSPEATLAFPEPGRLGGNASCNSFGGEYEVAGDQMTVTEVSRLLIGCQHVIVEQEERYLHALQEVERYSFEGDELFLHTRAFDAPLRFEPAGTSTAQPTPAPAGAWTGLPPLASGARQETAVVAFQGEIVVIGGFDGRGQVSNLVEAFNPASNTWRRLPDVPIAMHHANAAVVGDRVYILGFLTGSDFAADGRMYVLTAGATRWELAGNMPAGTQRGSSGVGVIDGKVYLAGGLRNGSIADFSRFDPATSTWEDLPAVPQIRDHIAAGVVDGKFILAGGRGGAITSITGRVDVFDPVAGKWGPGAPMLTPRAGGAAAVLDGRLYVFGGEGNVSEPSGVFPQAEVYELSSNSWTALTPMATPRHGTGAATLGDSIYVPGGATRQAFGAVATSDKFTP